MMADEIRENYYFYYKALDKFSLFYLMFLMDAIKPNIDKKIKVLNKNLFYFSYTTA